jgi:hypothetical protein
VTLQDWLLVGQVLLLVGLLAVVVVVVLLLLLLQVLLLQLRVVKGWRGNAVAGQQWQGERGSGCVLSGSRQHNPHF